MTCLSNRFRRGGFPHRNATFRRRRTLLGIGLIIGLSSCSLKSDIDGAVPDPEVHEIRPDVQTGDDPLPVTIEGEHFVVKIRRRISGESEFEIDKSYSALLRPSETAGGAPVHLTNVRRLADATLKGVVPAGVTPGVYDVEVTTPYGAVGSLPEGFTVVDDASVSDGDSEREVDTGDIETDSRDPRECGDGVAGADEACDGDDLKGQTCSDFGYERPTGLACAGCELDFSGCRGCDAAEDPDWDGVCNPADPDDDNDGCPDEDDPTLSEYPSLDLLLVAADEDPLTPEWNIAPEDEALLALLDEMGHRVTTFFCSHPNANTGDYADAVDPDGDGEPDFDVIFISDSCDARNMFTANRYVLEETSVGQMTNEGDLYESMGLATTIDVGMCPSTMSIVDAGHFITSPFGAVEVDLYHDLPDVPTECLSLAMSTGTLAGGLRVLGGYTQNASGYVLFYVNPGEALLDGVAEARIVGFGARWVDAPGFGWSGAAKGLFYRALLYAAGRERDFDADGDLIGDDCDPSPDPSW